MYYEFQCPRCASQTVVQRTVADRNLPVACDCGTAMRRLVSDATLCVNQPRYLPENREVMGRDARERMEMRKRSEKLYNERWDRALAEKKANPFTNVPEMKPKDLAECYYDARKIRAY